MLLSAAVLRRTALVDSSWALIDLRLTLNMAFDVDCGLVWVGFMRLFVEPAPTLPLTSGVFFEYRSDRVGGLGKLALSRS